jgi:hypothetical protein
VRVWIAFDPTTANAPVCWFIRGGNVLFGGHCGVRPRSITRATEWRDKWRDGSRGSPGGNVCAASQLADSEEALVFVDIA